jgi:glutamate/aspartate transport system substrate-binding protein
MKSLNRIALALLALGLSAAVPAQELTGTLKKIKDTGTITIAYRDASIPFSYLDDNQKPVGYSMDICYKIVDAVKARLKMPDLKVALSPVSSATRIPLIANGTVDMECGSTTNNLEREQQVSFLVTTFVTSNRLLSKTKNKIVNLEDLKGKTLVSTSGTSNLKQVTELNGSKNLGINIVTAADHPAAFQMVESDRAAAFAMDDILLYSLVAQSKNPSEFYISAVQLSTEPYGIMVRKGDPEFKKLGDDAVTALMKSGEINKIYTKWFQSPIPPKNSSLNVPMSDTLKKVIANPTDSGDPAAYH